jgi:hypothetical protein
MRASAQSREQLEETVLYHGLKLAQPLVSFRS